MNFKKIAKAMIYIASYGSMIYGFFFSKSIEQTLLFMIFAIVLLNGKGEFNE